ncbi:MULTISPECIES: plasmid partitioning protein RepA [Rhizobium]|uniref:Plasmid partitioning protein RepA n=1 Tax=Rhizobium rhododendri TaxID=2506430 RepID=A0ABY8IRB7_9HYPH|nr:MULTISPECIES: plasmid partitioning protein RepA [Rhizobium]MBZ5763742.1 plasmid partitioning protein RepA [Rhizobium sp. VS19-DR96]MBZ5769675.1 plasmid partitioning protein RepA [Rhizobium sp. VS19-DR129.2]MBZ5777221.1 plasmid partitioning protein RepA [Rhizobium sp. VS19-DRK62.2]MBZ5788352.1 plasmid partitioning protein RepA [Rhizobium sp. VS19-DR121]MBZ5805799.1 plasmid partitioning protein RepA [Rhizobium sp. VS19-DR181]
MLQPASQNVRDTASKIGVYTSKLSAELNDMREAVYPPSAQKTFARTFSTLDLVRLLNVPESTLRQMTIEGKGPVPERADNNRRTYTVNQVKELRSFLAKLRPDDAGELLPHRRMGEKLQVIATANFKGGSSKTTTSIHLAHFLGLQGYRVLCLDLDPQASMTALFGIQPEFDLGENETTYASIRYDNERRSLVDIIRPTYFPGVDLVPGNLELMDFEFDTPSYLTSKNRDDLGLFFERLSNALARVDDRYDIVIIDTPPSLGYSTLAALYAATSLIITVHPAMLDVASCNQFLIMISDLSEVLAQFGAKFEHDFFRFLLTRVNPNDGPQKYMSGVMRRLFGDDVLVSEALESTAIAGAAVAKKTLYELEAGEVGREALKRAIESADRVNFEILDLIHKVWGRIP